MDSAAEMVEIGRRQENGDEDPSEDIQSEIGLYRDAFLAGSGEGATSLAECYWKGKGVDQDLDEAKRLFGISVQRGDGRGMHLYGKLLESEGQAKQALDLYLLAAEEGQYFNAYCSAGEILQSGAGDVERDPERAFELFEKAEELIEDPTCKARVQRNIGSSYRGGIGTPKNLEKAVEWFEKALANDDTPESEMGLGNCFRELNEPLQALKYFEAASSRGHGRAGVNAGLLLEKGNGIPQDKARAALNYKRAVLAGEPIAFVYLGQAYATGDGVRENGTTALSLYERAAQMGCSEGSLMAAEAYFCGLCDLPEENKEKAIFYWTQCMERGYGRGTFCLARVVYDGDGCEQNVGRSIELHELAFEQGYVDASAEAGLIYENGAPGVSQDYSKANELYKRAADAGSGLGALYYGLNLEGGKGVEEDKEEACRYYLMGTKAKNAKAMTCMGVMLLNGNGCEQDDELAAKMFRMAAESGDPRGARNLAACYSQGRGVPANQSMAIRFTHTPQLTRPPRDLVVPALPYRFLRNKLPSSMSVDSSLSREDAKAQLGILYENGDGGFEADIGMAIKLYTEAFEAGSGEGAVCLGVCYANGNGVERSMEEARRYFKISAERENGRGMDHHGRMLEADGKGEEALSFYLRAAEEKQNYEAYVSAGCLLDSGESGIEKDVERAYEYFVKAEQMTTVLRVKAKAQRYIAYAYRDGDGVEKDLNEAVRWFEKAIENNDGPGSEMALGTCYKEMGNPKMALECFESANKNGFGRAGVAAALMLENADGVPQDKERAAINYKRAVLTGEPVAFVYLGQAYEAGSGVPQNGSMALALYERGAALGNPEGSLLAGLTYCRGECDLPKQNHPKANMYFGKCMEQGFGSGTACLARAVRDGHGCERDGAKAIQLFEKSFDQNYPQGAAEAGVVYENGAPGVPADIDKANACYKRAAEAGSGLGALYYGLNLEGGKGMEANNEEACKYYRMGVEAGNPKAMTCLGVMLLHGNGCEQNEEEAASMFASGAAGGDPRAARNLAACYAQGRGVGADQTMAMRYALEAAVMSGE